MESVIFFNTHDVQHGITTQPLAVIRNKQYLRNDIGETVAKPPSCNGSCSLLSTYAVES